MPSSEGQYICDFGEGGLHAIRHIFFPEVSAGLMKLSSREKGSQETVVPMKHFSAFSKYEEIQELDSQNQLLKNIRLSELSLASFSPEHTASFLLSTLNSFQEVLKGAAAAAAAAHDLVLVEVDGKCQSVADSFALSKVGATGCSEQDGPK